MADCPGCTARDREILLVREELSIVRGERRELLDRILALTNPAVYRTMNPQQPAERPDVRHSPPRPNFPGFTPNRRPPTTLPPAAPAVTVSTTPQADGSG